MATNKKQSKVSVSAPPKCKPVTMADLVEIENLVSRTISRVRDDMLAPDSIKTSPTFTTGQLMGFCGLDKGRFDYLMRQGELPNGREEGSSRRRFGVKDVGAWCRFANPKHIRPAKAPAIVISVANFKGGVTKTSTAVTLAQGLGLRGHKILLIDTDAQASMTNLFGILPDTDMSLEQDDVDRSLLPLFLGNQDSIDYAIQSTYWPGIDIVASNLALFSAEFALPARQQRSPNFEFWHVLRDGLAHAREVYDIIIIDTAPSLSYTTINGLLASDGLIMPLPPSHLDFLSSAQFWSLLNELLVNLVSSHGAKKEFAFVDILLSKVDSNDAASQAVRRWIAAAYTDLVLPVEIPKTSATLAASAEFGTIYDLDSATVNARTYQRAFEAYERFVEIVEQQIVAAWINMGKKHGN